ncbi:hypothetical protein EUTSA_v10015684mg [Eutrema salsugineum]|uniref:F-box domain-containing protein n=1 Tax=Eutrema salsugineum TaxID=72664 RepID=V4LGZ8_EUTSA|nr:hypothetical protein EUTSA_v10015684mg [Eutrema salsugineum]
MHTKERNSGSQPDRLSCLPNLVLIMIISHLSFKKCIQTSVLSKRWRNLCHQTKNIAFKESEYVNRIGCNKVFRFQGQVINSFEIHHSNPVGLGTDIEYLIEFAISKQVNKLVLDFSNPAWRTTSDVSWREVIIDLPECLYRQKSVESLYIYACRFDLLKFANQDMLRSLFIGWTGLKKVECLLSKFPLLKSLSIKNCWELDSMMIEGQIKELVIENCDFPLMSCSFDLPNVDIFKYSGHMFFHASFLLRKHKDRPRFLLDCRSPWALRRER